MALATPSPTAASALGSFYNDAPSSPGSSDADKDLKDPAAPTSPPSTSLGPPTSPYPQHIHPSPVDSNGTASTDETDIDEEEQDNAQLSTATLQRFLPATSRSPQSPDATPGKLETAGLHSIPPDSDPTPQSVIHAPPQFIHLNASPKASGDAQAKEAAVLSPLDSSGSPAVSLSSPSGFSRFSLQRKDSNTSPLNTDLPPVKVVDRSTPRAQTRQEAEDEWTRRRRRSMSLEDILESHDAERRPDEQTSPESPQRTPQLTRSFQEQETQVDALSTALSECWTLCKTLGNLSSNHRTQIFAYRGQPQVQEHAWKSCWRLCQSLYDTRDDDHAGLVLPTLEMCRDFCQCLFEARQKQDEVSDSVLRVSFELNNHLYNTHDRNLPSAFQERTLDFYLTLCHRLMKQRTSLPQETDALLRACWTLAELLFSIRQNKRDGKAPDEELLSSAVQACWELTDLFREGWSQVRPGTSTDRGTPRSVQSGFPSQASVRSHSAFSPRSSPSVARSASSRSYRDPRAFPPETPTTIFDDTAESPLEESEESNVPNILVLGPEQSSTSHHDRWPSSASTLSGYSESSQRTSSTATAPTSSKVAAHLARIRILLLKTATNAGFQSSWSSPSGESSSPSARQSRAAQAKAQTQALLAFVKGLLPMAFGAQPSQTALLENYKRLVKAWPAVVQSGTTSAANSTKGGSAKTSEREVAAGMTTLLVVPPAVQKRASPSEVASAVRWMMRSERNTWLRDLFRHVFGYVPEDAEDGVGAALSG